MSAMARDFASSDPCHSIADRSHAIIARGIIGGVIGAVSAVAVAVVLAIAPAGHVLITAIWILVGVLEFVAVLSVCVGVLGRVMWKRRQAVLRSRPPVTLADKGPAIDLSPPAG